MTGTVITATLIRGIYYNYKDTEFRRGKPVEVSESLADELEDLVEVVWDSDKMPLEKDRFHIDREADPIALRKEKEALVQEHRRSQPKVSREKKSIPNKPQESLEIDEEDIVVEKKKTFKRTSK